jgi:hypothetical protein
MAGERMVRARELPAAAAVSGGGQRKFLASLSQASA